MSTVNTVEALLAKSLIVGDQLSLQAIQPPSANAMKEEKKKHFVDLIKDNVQPSEVFKWSSSVQIADQYAAFYLNNSTVLQSSEREHFLCHCRRPSTFGRYCEYTLTHEADSFEQSQRAQANLRLPYATYHQVHGDIVCYKTLACDSGHLCLDWRDVCDGEQQCDGGWDEENCEKLEFNECEEDEYRCTNGMCIPEEYWLDGKSIYSMRGNRSARKCRCLNVGEMDCMDWTDENLVADFGGLWCFGEKTTVDCDEHLCHRAFWSCGDGQCINWHNRLVFQNVLPQVMGCYNLRNMNYMCELTSLGRGWTLPTGLCWFMREPYDDPRFNVNNDGLSKDDKCVYLLRCLLSNGMEADCPCNSGNCSKIMSSVCEAQRYYRYPQDSIIRPYTQTLYHSTGDFKDKVPHFIMFDGNVKCRGYQGHFVNSQQNISVKISLTKGLISYPWWDCYVCSYPHTIQNRNSSLKYADDCWKDSLTFNGQRYAVASDVCPAFRQCLSQYRVNDGNTDCWDSADEKVFVPNKPLCSRVRKHRLQCSSDPSTCFTVPKLGDRVSDCLNNYDEYFYGSGRALAELKCQKDAPANCELLREYIKDSSLVFNSTISSHSNNDQPQDPSTSQIPFRSYCDTFWNLPQHIDESSEYCQHWICDEDQYQCQTGQCIPLDWLCDDQWDCADASDEEAMLIIQHWSQHNHQLQGLNDKRQICSQKYSNLSFSQLCDTKKEFPCLRSNVSDHLNVIENRPCIPYSKIGDGIEDCYNAYDEKNTFEHRGNMWGFSLKCENATTSYIFACQTSINPCAQIFCPSQYYNISECQKFTDAICLDDERCVPNGRCNRKHDCSYGEDEYWCPPNNVNELVWYRHKKKLFKDKQAVFYRQVHPLTQPASEPVLLLSQPLSSNSRKVQNSDFAYSLYCNKGVTAIYFVGILSCFCPPSYFGDKCQFFSDRITLVTHLNLTSWPSLSNTNLTTSMLIPTLFKIKVNFLFHAIVIDHYEFYSNPTVEIHQHVKHKFYLLYSRSTEMLSHKQTRFLNRTDIEINHPYSVHFDLYAFDNNHTTPIAMGAWHYPVYFDFLPSFRLAKVLRFPSWLGNASADPCLNHTCNHNSTCQPIFNQYNSYVCACKSGFYGKDCSKYEQSCETHCSPHSLCQPDGRSLISVKKDPFCVCPLGSFGPRCYLKYSQCESGPCLSNGSCVEVYESYGLGSFHCICSKLHYGDRCQYEKMAIRVRLNTSDMTKQSARANTIQFYDVDPKTLKLELEHQQISKGFPSSVYYTHGREIAPALGVVKAYFDSNQPKYFLIYIQPNTSAINRNSTAENCPSAPSLLQKNDLKKIPDVFHYHHLCRNDSKRLCFYDNDYLCICQPNHYRVDCFLHDTQIDRCSRCLSNGICIRDETNFLCLCPECHQGEVCELNLQAFGFTLDSLLVENSGEVKIGYLSLMLLFFLFGLFNNLCSFVTFKRPSPRKFGVGNYLLLNTCVNQMSLLFLLLKLIQITFGLINLESCKIISYLLSTMTRLTYWLTSWVTVDRLLTVVYPTSSALKSVRLAIGISIGTSLCVFVMHVHEIIYYTAIDHLSTRSSMCVTNFESEWISMYNRVSTLIHYLLPFVIQIIAITLLIVLAARSRNKATRGKMTFREDLRKQFESQKELYITPLIIILSALPQTILTFSLACTELKIWHRHLLLVTYFLSYAPQMLGFLLFVLPSTSYKKEFSATPLRKIVTSWLPVTKKKMVPAAPKKDERH